MYKYIERNTRLNKARVHTPTSFTTADNPSYTQHRIFRLANIYVHGFLHKSQTERERALRCCLFLWPTAEHTFSLSNALQPLDNVRYRCRTNTKYKRPRKKTSRVISTRFGRAKNSSDKNYNEKKFNDDDHQEHRKICVWNGAEEIFESTSNAKINNNFPLNRLCVWA